MEQLLGWGVGALATVLWWLVQQKVKAAEAALKDLQGEVKGVEFRAGASLQKEMDQIWNQQRTDTNLLTAKHEADASALAELRERIAREHYVKQELDQKFDRLEHTFSRGFENLGTKFDQLSGALLQHMQLEERRGQS